MASGSVSGVGNCVELWRTTTTTSNENKRHTLNDSLSKYKYIFVTLVNGSQNPDNTEGYLIPVSVFKLTSYGFNFHLKHSWTNNTANAIHFRFSYVDDTTIYITFCRTEGTMDLNSVTIFGIE